MGVLKVFSRDDQIEDCDPVSPKLTCGKDIKSFDISDVYAGRADNAGFVHGYDVGNMGDDEEREFEVTTKTEQVNC